MPFMCSQKRDVSLQRTPLWFKSEQGGWAGETHPSVSHEASSAHAGVDLHGELEPHQTERPDVLTKGSIPWRIQG